MSRFTSRRISAYHLVLILAVAVTATLLAACGGDEPTPEATPGERIAPPTIDIATPPPTPTPTAATSAPAPTLVPFEPTAEPSPTPTPAPTPIPQEFIDEIEAQLPTPRMDHQGILLDDGRVLFAGGTLPTVANNGLIIGQPHPTLEIYDPATEKWSLVLPIDTGFVDVNTVFLPDGTILVFSLRKPEYETNPFWPLRTAGEDSSPLPLHTVFRLDTEEQTLAEVSAATVPRLAPSLIAMADGRVMVVGGSSMEVEEGSFSIPMVTEVEIYDPTQNTWEIAAPLGGNLLESLVSSDEEPQLLWTGPYQGGAAVVLAGEVEDADPQGVIMSYDATADEWTTLTEFRFESISRSPRATVVSSGAFTFFYGDRFDGYRMEVFDPASGEWSSAILRQSVPRSASVTELPDGRLFIAGGDQSPESGLPGATTLVYDPSTGVWAPGPDLAETRSNHSATVLPDGSVLLFSGVTVWEENESEGVPTNSMEIVPTAQIAAVDTATPREDGAIGASPWEACIGATDIEVPPLSSGGDVETALSATEIIRQSAQAMAELESYAVDAVYNFRQVNQSGHPSSPLNSLCTYGESVFEAPDRLASRVFEVHEGQAPTGELLTIGETTYRRPHGENLWGTSINHSINRIAPHSEFLDAETEESFDYHRDLAIVNVDGLEVFRITSVMTSLSVLANTTIWVGTEDMLLRRIYYSERESKEVELSDEAYTLDVTFVFHSFNEDFDIQVPPDSEVADSAE